MKRGPYKAHPARLALGLHGYTLSAVADHVGMTPGGVSRQLSGECRLSEPVRDALLELIGPDGLADVVAAIPQREAIAA